MNEKAESVVEMYASKAFNDAAMRKYLPGDTYKQLKKTIDRGRPLDTSLADIVANGMKRWALDMGATHFTHWFQPMNGFTAEKHDSFINPIGDGGIIMTFSGKELVRGESDASSFPSGGLRATFEARGYTTWDCTSPAFVKDDTLYIPTCFCSFTGEVLDKKTPLLRSMEALCGQCLRVLRLMGNEEAERVVAMAGAEQEYFLIDKDLFNRRRDLVLCGRTLFGAKPSKGQELDDHYYGNIKENVMDFMREVDRELWALGVPAKTEHNEAAPSQHELAPVYTTVNIASDQNQLIMETLKKVAQRKNLVCLLHEKPFAGVNGSGKHNNWSVNVDGQKSLLNQGKTPADNAQFLIFLTAVLWAVDEYADLLRVTIAGAGNDHRLGGNEAPPAIVSVFLGDMLTDILTEIETGGKSNLRQGGSIQIGVTTIPDLPKDISDRNRTSPFAFTGNKFEFRMLGASMSIADCNTVLNVIVAEILSRIADRLAKADDVNAEVHDIIRDIMRQHKRIIFNGNNYSEEWREEAARRGLPRCDSSVDAAEALIAPKNVEVFEKFGVLSKKELEARYEIRHEGYSKVINVEALAMLEMAKREILPAVIKYTGFVANGLNAVKETGLTVDVTAQSGLLKDLSAAAGQFKAAITKLEKALEKAPKIENAAERAHYYHDKVVSAMESLREVGDRLEVMVGEEYWPMPTYAELLFGIRN